MVPLRTRQVLIWAGLPLTILLSYLWFKRKNSGLRSDTGKRQVEKQEIKTLEEELQEASEKSPTKTTSFSRSLSGVDSEPIDIVFPPEIRAKKPSPVIITDEDLDFEIEKIKSMKSENFSKKSLSPSKNSLTTTSSTVGENITLSFRLEAGNVEEPASKTTIDTAVVATTSESEQVLPIEEIKERVSSCVDEKDIDSCPVNEKMTKSKRRLRNSQKSKTMTSDCGNGSQDATENAKDSALNETTVENKLKSLQLDSKPISSSQSHQEEYNHRTSCERDSANHSPADLMLASPSLSLISDNHSEGSSDSGKGGSDVVTPPPSRTPACDGSMSEDVLPMYSMYEFFISQGLVGRLIGRQGGFVTLIKDRTRAHILIKKHPDNPKFKVCQIEGTQMEIENALKMIRQKFPEKRYPDLTLEQVSLVPSVPIVPLIPEHLCLKLIEGINNDTIVSCMVAPNHLFLQQPTHPTFPNLAMLSNCLNACYIDANSPLLPNPISENTVCIAQSLGAWYRAIVLSTDLEEEISYVKFLDYGGYINIPNSELRQIRADFLSLPFQASECFLANIRPVGGDETPWTDEAYSLVAELTKGSILCTQVVGLADDRIPLVDVYIVIGPQSVVFLNGELVKRGYAEWIPSEDCINDDVAAGTSSTTLTTATDEHVLQVAL